MADEGLMRLLFMDDAIRFSSFLTIRQIIEGKIAHSLRLFLMNDER